MTRVIPAPAAGLIDRRVGDEYIVIDGETAHQLTGPAALAWAAAGTTADIDPAAVAALVSLGLLVEPGIDRRTMLRRTGRVAGGIGIASIVLPMAAAAASTPTSTATLVIRGGPEERDGCGTVVTGIGLLPGSTVTFYTTPFGATQPIITQDTVGNDGTYSHLGNLAPSASVYVTGVDPNGAQVVSNTVTC